MGNEEKSQQVDQDRERRVEGHVRESADGLRGRERPAGSSQSRMREAMDKMDKDQPGYKPGGGHGQ